MATLDDIRKSLKAGAPRGPKSESYVAPKSPGTDPLASLRAQVKGGKTQVPASKNLLPDESSSSTRLARIEAAVNAIALTLTASQLTTLKAAVAAIK
jgi:hypothetical protein